MKNAFSVSLNSLTAISPVDGRYREQASEAAGYFSEAALMKYRLLVEVEYFIALCELSLPQLSGFNPELFPKLRDIYSNFSTKDAGEIKSIEQKTNHDVKAVEYFLGNRFRALNLQSYIPFIHFGLTSQDINNTAIPFALRDAMNNIYYPLLEEAVKKFEAMTGQWKDVTMLAHTHGQPASPTCMGKEIAVFAERLRVQYEQLRTIPYSAKFGGATGNFNAHYAAYPQIDWPHFADTFINKTLGLSRSHPTTQIEHYDNLAALCDNLRRINTIVIDMDQDMWLYLSMNYFKQKFSPDEVGSSTMPHKVNPIDFENSEGNAGIANALFVHFAQKLPVSRLQRDLTDSTLLRNLGVAFTHTTIAFKSLLKGLDKLEINRSKIEKDLEENWIVIAEAIQTILRREGVPDAYEQVRDFVRSNHQHSGDDFKRFISTLKVADEVKEELNKITPFSYTGVR